ncbi:hypothetical protein M2165_001384 [Variovorax sp. TBS-050B]|uniref:HEPN domain-containing protein n=1 Tax=Variovorax sp. TBS-050B TaxID=2940551 RepID=UPI002473CAFA|nr:HEPN domain-containing protein [Variovorax sp. TBS-050B]MDH6591495.1 hypothetical protein [Variovorax sp. TBS-050B]
MVALTTPQKKALVSYLRTWKIMPGAEVEVLDTATDRFCEVLLQDQPWRDIWSIDDVKELVEEARLKVAHTASARVLGDPALMYSALERHLLAEIESYPRDYFVYVELPGLDPSYLDEEILVLSDQVALIRTSSPLKEIKEIVRPSFPFGSGNLLEGAITVDEAREALRPISSFLLEQDSVYLRIAESGALPDLLYGDEPALLPRALTSVKILVFYGLEIGLLERREIFRGRDQNSGPRTIAHIAVHAVHGEERRPEKMSRDFENFLRGVTFNYSDGREVASSEHRNLALDLHPIVRFLSLLHSDDHALRIAAGMEWLIDSLVTTNQTLSLVQSCIGIEAILGDSNSGSYELGITARLSERFAYLMGTSAENRSELRERLRAIFAKRGDLVHARRHRLPPSDLQVVHAAQKMLQELIRKELSLVLDLPPVVLGRLNPVEIKRDLRTF